MDSAYEYAYAGKPPFQIDISPYIGEVPALQEVRLLFSIKLLMVARRGGAS